MGSYIYTTGISAMAVARRALHAPCMFRFGYRPGEKLKDFEVIIKSLTYFLFMEHVANHVHYQ